MKIIKKITEFFIPKTEYPKLKNWERINNVSNRLLKTQLEFIALDSQVTKQQRYIANHIHAANSQTSASLSEAGFIWDSWDYEKN